MSGSVQTTGIPNYKQDFRWLAKSAHVSLSSYASLKSSHLRLSSIIPSTLTAHLISGLPRLQH